VHGDGAAARAPHQAPAGHAVGACAKGGQKAPAGQGAHASAEAREGAPLKVPPGHGVVAFDAGGQ
jgi:hypothetical protein